MRPEESYPAPQMPQGMPIPAPAGAKPPTVQERLNLAGIEQTGTHKSLHDYKISDKTCFYDAMPGGMPNTEQFGILFSDTHTPKELAWWENAVKRALEVTQAFTISEADIKDFFKSSEDFHSYSIDKIMEDLVQKGIVLSKEQFLHPDKGQSGALQRLGAYFSSFIWTPEKPSKTEEYVYLPNIEASCNVLIAWIDRQTDPEKLVLTMEYFKRIVPEQTDLVLHYLQHTLQRAHVLEGGVTLLQKARSLRPEEAQKEQSLLKLKAACAHTNQRIAELETKAQEHKQTAVQEGRAGNTQGALLAVKLLKMVKAQIANAQSMLQNLETTMIQLDTASFMPKIVQGLKLGRDAMKEQQKDMSPEKADEIMLDVEEAFTQQAEISRALAGEPNVEEDLELEKELAALGSEPPPPPPSEGGGKVSDKEEDEELSRMLEELTLSEEEPRKEEPPQQEKLSS